VKQEPKQSAATSYSLFNRLRAEINSWFVWLGLVLGIFLIFASITSLLERVFGWPLLPVFQNSLGAFRAFTHYAIDSLFYDPTSWIIAHAIYLFLVGSSYFLPIRPFVPVLHVPAWFTDAAVISLIMLRAQTGAMKYATPFSTHGMTPGEKQAWLRSLATIPIYLRIPISALWYAVLMIYVCERAIRFGFRALGLGKLGYPVSLYVASALMLGLLFFAHDGLLLIATRDWDSEYVCAHRKFMLWMGASIVCAVVASLAVYAWNGYML